jgi:hypothetical protein
MAYSSWTLNLLLRDSGASPFKSLLRRIRLLLFYRNRDRTGSRSDLSHQGERLLALEVRPQKFGFAVFDAPIGLLDWGSRNYRGLIAERQTALRKHIADLMERYAPSKVVTRSRRGFSKKAEEAICAALHVIRAEAGLRSIKVQSLSTQEIRRFFANNRCTTKHQIASLLAKWFEELSSRIPPRRKPWHSEAYVTSMFDAVATGVAFLDRTNVDRSGGLSPGE